MNGLVVKEKISKEYRVMSTGKSTKINYLLDMENNKIISFGSFGFTTKPKMNTDGDTVNIAFDKGLLGYLHNPEITKAIPAE